MFRSLVCVAMTAILLGGENAAFAAPPQASVMDCRIAEHRPKRLRRLGNRLGAKHPTPPIQLDVETPTGGDDPPSSPATAPNTPVRLDVSGGWSGSASTNDDLADHSAAALFPTTAPISQTE